MVEYTITLTASAISRWRLVVLQSGVLADPVHNTVSQLHSPRVGGTLTISTVHLWAKIRSHKEMW